MSEQHENIIDRVAAPGSEIRLPEKKLRVLLIFLRYSSSFTAYPWVLSRGGRLIVDVIANANHSIHYSVWVDQRIRVKRGDQFVQKLRERLDQMEYDDVLCVDEPARDMLLATGVTERFPEIAFLNNDLIRNRVATDKNVFTDWCREHGLGVPRSVAVSNSEEARAAVEKIGFPCVFKGLGNSGGQGLIRVRDSDELEQACEDFSGMRKWLVQELILGFVGTSVFVSRGGRVFASSSYINQCSTAQGLGPAVVCKPHNYESIDNAIEVIGSHVDGFTGFDWILRMDGSLVLIDPHFGRMVPSGAVAHLAGVDLGAAYYESLSGERTTTTDFGEPASFFWIFPQSLQLLLEGGIFPAIQKFSPLKQGTRFFLCAPGDWKMACHQSTDYLLNSIRIRMGAIKNRVRLLFRSK